MDTERKKALWGLCAEEITQSLARLTTVMEQAQQEANKETKSSAGDKYETNRSMLQLEKERFAMQCLRLQTMYDQLTQINFQQEFEAVQEGALVETSIGWFFLAVGLGERTFEGEVYRCISMDSPIGKAMEGCEEGDIIEFRDTEFEILSLC